jgi:hypothetical protein
VPFEFGAGRQRSMSIAQLLLEEVIEAPSYLRIATILSDSLDLRNWTKEIDSRAAKAASSLPIPDLPRVTRIKVQPKWV